MNLNFSGQIHLTTYSSGVEISIKDLALIIQEIVNHKGEIEWDKSKPNGTPRKLLNSQKFRNLGWKSKITLKDGIRLAYKDYLKNLN